MGRNNPGGGRQGDWRVLLSLLAFVPWFLSCSANDLGGSSSNYVENCIDLDGDGYGRGCNTGRDCNDDDPSITNGCEGASCATTPTAPGCSCADRQQGDVVECGEQEAIVSGTVMCGVGAQVCDNGYWTGCSTTLTSTLKQGTTRKPALQPSDCPADIYPCAQGCRWYVFDDAGITATVGAAVCSDELTCNDGIQDQGEEGIDCGGPCPKACGDASYLINATFTDGGDGLGYVDDAFLSTNSASAASGVAGGGVARIKLGEIPAAGASSGGYRGTFDSNTGVVHVQFDWTLAMPNAFLTDECTEILVSVDGQLYGPDDDAFVFQLCNGGNAHGSYSFTTSVLQSGNHIILVGGHLNKNEGGAAVTRLEAEAYTGYQNDVAEGTDGGRSGGDTGFETCGDTGGGLDASWIDPGDYIEWTYDAPVAGQYTINSRVAGNGGNWSHDILIDGVRATTISGPKTGGWQDYVTATGSSIYMTAGTHTIRLAATTKDQNINYIEIGEPSFAPSATITLDNIRVNSPTATVCGNGVCEGVESCANCASDCGACSTTSCGDANCDTNRGETCDSCRTDCGDCLVNCGNGVCNTSEGEGCGTCETDCGSCDPGALCGDAVCNPHESCNNCATDCGTCVVNVCGDDQCDAGEDCAGCATDCGVCEIVNGCGDAICAVTETCGSCESDCGECGFDGCGDAACIGVETCSTCQTDCGECGACGDAVCSDVETCLSCESDCGTCPSSGSCGDDVCSVTENCALCATDCGACRAVAGCGDAVCDGVEDCTTCESDCGECPFVGCGDAACQGTEDCDSCPTDCGDCGPEGSCGDAVCDGIAETCSTCATDCGACLGIRCGDTDCNGIETCSTCAIDCNPCPADPCGDAFCATATENCGTCETDCGVCSVRGCGDALCEASEDCSTCATDCGTCNGGAVCGDARCKSGETCSTCATDCGACVSAGLCGNHSCEVTETCSTCAIDCGACLVVGGCGNGTCSGGETCSSCASDCGVCAFVGCGDASCNAGAGETCTTCVSDCGTCPSTATCGNGTCSAADSETCATCVSDCGVCPANVCGDNSCGGGETCTTCAKDCGACPTNPCGNAVCGAGETCSNCVSDCGVCPFVGCGDAICNGSETCGNCQSDCGRCNPGETCGNGTCAPGETCSNCVSDCGNCPVNTCGNLSCGGSESCTNCAKDCGACPTNPCGNGVCGAGENCTSCATDCGTCGVTLCGNSVCNTAGGETCSNCASDCGACPPGPVCGDATCNMGSGETCTTCASDCGACPVTSVCGNGTCQAGETCSNCAKDCGGCIAIPNCGNALCGAGETCTNCAKDCGVCPFVGCGDASCNAGGGETCTNCPTDCGACIPATVCGNAVCQTPTENCTNCASDCGTCIVETCGNGTCSAGAGETCSSCVTDCGICAFVGCSDGTCNMGAGENCTSCPSDCGVCGPGEYCGNADCDNTPSTGADLRINTTAAGANVTTGTITNFPLLIRLNASNFDFNLPAADGSNIRFFRSDNVTPISYEIERYSKPLKLAEIWVLIPTVAVNSSTNIFKMTWNGTGGSQSDGSKVFDKTLTTNDWDVAHHMVTTTDSTGQGNNLTTGVAPYVATDCVIGKCYDFNGTTHYLRISDNATLDFGNTFTASFWLKYEGTGANSTFGRVISRKDVFNANNGWEFNLWNNDTTAQATTSTTNSSGGPQSAAFSNAWSASTWKYVTVVFSNTNVTIYENRTPLNAFTGQVAVVDNALPLTIGNNAATPPNEAYFNGKIDEVRIHDTTDAASFIALSYETQKPGASAVSVTLTGATGTESCSTCPSDCGACAQGVCGNGTCSNDEDCTVCALDCGVCALPPSCGDGSCNTTDGESCSTCVTDCGICPFVGCGDRACNTAGGESCSSCPSDCGTCTVETCGNGTCSPGAGETCSTCAKDCGACQYCGDALCNNGETCTTCESDCKKCPVVGCGDRTCNTAGGETCGSCPTDCACPAPYCGDNTCNGSETQATCAVDCVGGPYCGNTVCNTGETCSTCASDCGVCGTTTATSANLTINTTSSGANVTANDVASFPLLVRLNSSNFNFALAASGGTDVRFATSGGTPLPYEIEKWNAGTQEAQVWVLVNPVTKNLATQYIVMSWGNSGGLSSSGSSVFPVNGTTPFNWGVVHHMLGTTGANGNNMTLGASAAAPATRQNCVIGDCRFFDGTDDYAYIPNATNLGMGNDFTASFWMQFEGTSANTTARRILSRKNAVTDTTGWELALNTNDVNMNVFSGNSSTGVSLGAFSPGFYSATPFWRYITVAFSGTTITAYDNGVAKTALTGQVGASTSTFPLTIGDIGTVGGQPNFFGKLDEIRLHDVVDTADFIKLSYENQKPTSTTLGVSINGAVPRTASNDITLEAECRSTSAGAYATTATAKSGFTGAGHLTSVANTPTVASYDGTSADKASYNFSATAGTYNVYFRVDVGANDDSDNSFYYRIDNGTWFRYNLNPGTGWLWILGGGGTVALNGAHTLQIANSESGLSIDRIMIRETSLGAPSGVGGLAYNCGTTSLFCGDDACNNGETTATCSSDCGVNPTVCGNGTCQAGAGETCTNCVTDCGVCTLPLYCGDASCNNGETPSTCALDCGLAPIVGCGDGTCSGAENCLTCAWDCGSCALTCGNGTCDTPAETCTVCQTDCGVCANLFCGDNICNNGETCSTCARDCTSCAGCGDAICAGGESCSTCVQDCGTCSGGAPTTTPITINTTSSGGGANTGAVSGGFPLLVRLTSANFNFSTAASGGTDVRFYSSAGVGLNYEIEKWDATLQEAQVWVLVPTINGSDATQHIFMGWGNTGGIASSGTLVFPTTVGSGFGAVHHMRTASGANGQNNLTLSPSPTGTLNCLIGDCYDFDGADDKALIGAGANTSLDFSGTFTASFWVKWETGSNPSFARMLSRKNAYSDSLGWEVNTWSDASSVQVNTKTDGGTQSAAFSQAWSAQQWTYVTTVFNAGTVTLYENRTSRNGTTWPIPAASDNDLAIAIGDDVDGTDTNFNGKIDEVRLHDATDSADYVALSYETQKPSQTAVTLGYDGDAAPVNAKWLEAECKSTSAGNYATTTMTQTGFGWTGYILGNTNNDVDPYSGTSADRATYNINMAAGSYYIYFRVDNNASTGDDSWFYRIDNGTWVTKTDPVTTADGFHWVQGSSTPVTLSGTQTLEVAVKENGLGIDRIAILTTSSLPTGTGSPASNCGVAPAIYCGDNLCNNSETQITCPTDCGRAPSCGDGVNNNGETCSTCPTDVGICSPTAYCGNGVADAGETCSNCAKDRGACSPLLLACGNGTCAGAETCTNCATDCGTCAVETCGNGTCNSGAGETCSNCALDCAVCPQGIRCGDLLCNNGETCSTCAKDCGACAVCGNGTCNTSAGETCSNCASDCGSCSTAVCGNGTCNTSAGETCTTCAKDCNACPVGPYCGDNTCNNGETCSSCAKDCMPCAPGIRCGDLVCNNGETCSSCAKDCTACPVERCGNGACGAGEACGNCALDCGVCAPAPRCGDVSCNGGETCTTCATDCGACAPGIRCGDSSCNNGETCFTCARDCGACVIGCGDAQCTTGETCGNCESDCGTCINPYCGDATCNGAETCGTCPTDCGTCPSAYCGNMSCDAGESSTNCATDCGVAAYCGDALCAPSETCTTCASDCGACGGGSGGNPTTANITINTSSMGLTGSLTNFPLLVRLTSSNFNFSYPASNGSDIRFATSGGTSLPYEIESWDSGGQTANIWVLVSSIAQNSNSQYIVMSWGNSGGSQSNGQNVFTASEPWNMVHHMVSFTDSTPRGNSLTTGNAPPLATDCVIGSCYDFDGTNHHLFVNNSGTLDVGNVFTASFWVKFEGGSANNAYRRIISRKNNYNDGNGWELNLWNNDTQMQMNDSASGATSNAFTTTWNSSTWTYVTAVYNGTNVTLYQNGTQNTPFTGRTAVVDNDLRLGIGTDSDNNESNGKWVGRLDELRIHDQPESADWVKVSYETQKPGATAVTVTTNGSTGGGSTSFIESGGTVVMEAENDDTNITRTADTWTEIGDGAASNSKAMQAVPNDGSSNTTNWVTAAAEMVYKVKFATTGTYKVWVLGKGANAADDSVHYGVDGVAAGADSAYVTFLNQTAYGWKNLNNAAASATLTISTAGEHTFHLWMREDGTVIDKILLTTSSTTPSGTGPAESARGTGSTGSSDISLEAECASTSTAGYSNTVTTVAGYTGAGHITNVGNTLAASYDGSSVDTATYSINATSGTYNVYFRVNIPSSAQDSWFYRFGSGAWTLVNNSTPGGWAWIQGTGGPVTLNGAHTLSIANRESGLSIDRIMVRSTALGAPTGTGGTANNCPGVAYCDDAICNNGETCTTCATDCGACTANFCGNAVCAAPETIAAGNCVTDCGAPPAANVCFNGICSAGESCSSCARDCGACVIATCGNGTCSGAENCGTCAVDCGVCVPSSPVCGNALCTGSETCSTCATDCGTCPPTSVCGNSTCEAGETCSACATDCGACPASVCGNASCQAGESCSNCAVDCGACAGVCGDLACNGGETCATCAKDCGACTIPPFCGDAACNSGETCSTCVSDCGVCVTPRCGDAACNGAEDCSSCAKDCNPCVVTYCGDSACNGTEECGACALDCGICNPGPRCGDASCNNGETCTSCAKDCGACAPTPYCGNAACAGSETCSNCVSDCGVCPPADTCGDTICTSGETCSSCARDCGACPPGPRCGDASCNNGETCTSCAIDCSVCAPGPRCGDASCNNGETCSSCARDCGSCRPAPGCGDALCQSGETCTSCVSDCGLCPFAGCGDAVCNGTETCSTCESDCGSCFGSVPPEADDIWLEAECGTGRQGSYATPITAQGGYAGTGHLTSTSETVVATYNGSSNDSARYTFRVSAGSYNIWFRVDTNGTPADDSWFYKLDSGTWTTEDTHWSSGGSWFWVQGAGGPVTLNGTHTIHIANRENGLSIDRIAVRKTSAAAPTGPGSAAENCNTFAYCGNNTCNAGETCSNCATDCDVCEIPGCGNGYCEGAETCSTCATDCGFCALAPAVCGDSVCSGAESCSSCPSDCRDCTLAGTCGNRICDVGENCTSCAYDCGACATPAVCGDGACNGSEACGSCAVDCGSCGPGPHCGDGTCNNSETCAACATDCGVCAPVPHCGDGVRDAGEDCASCPSDSGDCAGADVCGNHECDGAETCSTCAIDCMACPNLGCGNDVCNGDEDCSSCATDCGVCELVGCGDDRCLGGETCASCATDCGVCVSLDQCGNAVCEATETCGNCKTDCGDCPLTGCGDALCNSSNGETCSSCESDCGTCVGNRCGDNACAGGETCTTCALDCGVCTFCGDATCGVGETCSSCESDCGNCTGSAATSSNIKIDTSASGANVTGDVGDFPLLVRLTSSNFNFSAAASDGSDIRFRTSTGTALSYEIGTWNSASQSANIWVLVPTVKGNDFGQYIVMTWGNTGGSQSNGSSVFANAKSWRAVHHMSSYTDSTGNANHLVNGAAPVLATDCNIGSCYDFNGTGQYLAINNSATLDFAGTFTTSVWMKYEGTANTTFGRIFSRKNAYNDNNGWESNLYNTDNTFQVTTSETGVAGGAQSNTFTNTWSSSQWTYVTVVHDADKVTLYENGAQKNYWTGRVAVADNDLRVALGTQSDAGGDWFNGKLDETRLYDGLQSANFVKLSYETQKPAQTTVTVTGNGTVAASNDIYLEAECGTTKAGNYATTQTSPKTGFTGAGYIQSANNFTLQNYNGTSVDQATYTFNALAGTYLLYFRVDRNASADDDSWFYSIDNGTWFLENRSPTSTTPPTPAGFEWLAQNSAVAVTLTAGTHTLSIANREDGLAVDRIAIRLSTAGAPTGTGGTANNCGASGPVGAYCGDHACGSGESCANCAIDCNACNTPRCGDRTCAANENCTTCASDCGTCINTNTCGNGACSATETCGSCALDCGVCDVDCGDSSCSATEDCRTCATDCGVCAPAVPVCGDSVCSGGENCLNCLTDCGSCPSSGSCGDHVCIGLPVEDCNSCAIDCGSCVEFSVCGDGQCTGVDETCDDCAIDCGICEEATICGDGACTGVENCARCAKDCGSCSGNAQACGDAICSPTTTVPETCSSCRTDCGDCATAICGNGVCGSGETCTNCVTDCGLCVTAVCGDHSCNAGETCTSCATDCGVCARCGDAACTTGETCTNCVTDCGACAVPPASATSIDLEAECATTKTGGYASSYTDKAGYSGTGALKSVGNTTTLGASVDLATYTITVPAGTYKLYFRLDTTDTGTAASEQNDSWFHRFDGGAWNTENNAVSLGAGWQWRAAKNGTEAAADLAINLSAGTHTLQIGNREDGLRIDKIALRLSTAAAPTLTGGTATNCPVVGTTTCGDALCASPETCTTCAKDCGACATGNVCGDALCNGSETCSSCASDCGSCPAAICGNATCELLNGETCANCATDCGFCQVCGDGECKATDGENCTTCAADCGACATGNQICGDSLCTGTEDCETCITDCGICGLENVCGRQSGGVAVADVCDPGETCQTCALDCGKCAPGPTCGDGSCTGAENCKKCAKDCGVCSNRVICGDAMCSSTESCSSCALDCGACAMPVCGDNDCEGDETCTTCAKDCGVCNGTDVCGNNVCDPNETCTTCQADCGICVALCAGVNTDGSMASGNNGGSGSGGAGSGGDDGTGVAGGAPPVLPYDPATGYLCGDGNCDERIGESCGVCLADCDCETPPAPASCPDSICQPNRGETCVTCPADCGPATCPEPPQPRCGDNVCQQTQASNGTSYAETCVTCPADCPLSTCNTPRVPWCGDGMCKPEYGENCSTCVLDCGGPCLTPPSRCGDGMCKKEFDENCTTCSQDCGMCKVLQAKCTAADQFCDANEDCKSCELNCGTCAGSTSGGGTSNPTIPFNGGIIAKGTVTLGDRVTIGSQQQPVDVTGISMNLGVEAKVWGNLAIDGNAILRDRAEVTGTLKVEGTLSLGNGVKVGKTENPAAVTLPNYQPVTANPGGSNYTLGPDQKATIPPGRYQNLVVESRATLTFKCELGSDGKPIPYDFASVQLRPESKIVFDTSKCDVIWKVKNALDIESRITFQLDQVGHWGVFATGNVTIRPDATFPAAIFAPESEVHVYSRTTINSIYGKNVILEPDIKILQGKAICNLWCGGSTTVVPSKPTAPKCGDGKCDLDYGESCGTTNVNGGDCKNDCGTCSENHFCGDNKCETTYNEACGTTNGNGQCNADCKNCVLLPRCGDGTCDKARPENQYNETCGLSNTGGQCNIDCGACTAPPFCGDGHCGIDIPDIAYNETCGEQNNASGACEDDCGSCSVDPPSESCGNSVCRTEYGENCNTCSGDCGGTCVEPPPEIMPPTGGSGGAGGGGSTGGDTGGNGGGFVDNTGATNGMGASNSGPGASFTPTTEFIDFEAEPEALCDVAQETFLWFNFIWDEVDTPGDSYIDVYIRTADVQDDLDLAPEVLIARIAAPSSGGWRYNSTPFQWSRLKQGGSVFLPPVFDDEDWELDAKFIRLRFDSFPTSTTPIKAPSIETIQLQTVCEVNQ